MREIKFRAWDKENKVFMPNEGYAICDGDVMGLRYGNEMEDVLTDQVELMQYTGLKDMNGVDIYECDVLKAVPVRRQYSTAFSLKEHVGTLVIGSQQLTVSGKTYDKELYDYEVIGNEFQNPELLEAGL